MAAIRFYLSAAIIYSEYIFTSGRCSLVKDMVERIIIIKV